MPNTGVPACDQCITGPCDSTWCPCAGDTTIDDAGDVGGCIGYVDCVDDCLAGDPEAGVAPADGGFTECSQLCGAAYSQTDQQYGNSFLMCLYGNCVTACSSGSSSGGSSGGGSGSSSGGSTSCTPPSSVPSSDVPPYVPVVQSINACSSVQIAGFVTACDSAGATAASCDNWQSDASNAGCLGCLVPSDDAGTPTNTGALLISAANTFVANLPGCLALQDPTSGPMCAANLEPYEQCTVYACSSCTTATDYDTCQQTADATGGACSSYASGAQTACGTEFADGGAATTTCSTDTDVITVICGSGQ